MWQTITDKSYWNKLVLSHEHSPFLQSWFWGEFQSALGRKVLRLVWQDKFFAQAIRMNLPGGFFYWYLPHSYLDDASFGELQKMLSNDGALFLRVDPLVELKINDLFHQIIPSTQPQCTLLLDLKKSPDSLLAAMHPKTRYNINLAQKKGVVAGEGRIEDFIRLNKETTRRDDFVSHGSDYYRKMYDILSFWSESREAGRSDRIQMDAIGRFAPSSMTEQDACHMKVWQAELNNKILANALIMYFGDTATYLHGASSNENRNVMAPYLLHWEIIKDAQKQGYKYYDWWGVNPEDKDSPAYKKSWEGITRFKRGFGGEFVQNPPSFDLIYRFSWYRLYRLLSRLRKLL